MIKISPKLLYFFLAYVLLLLIFRLTLSDVMVPDEIEQYIDASNFQLGYSDRQPPLYTWIVFVLFSIFGKSQFVIFFLTHAIILGFYGINYLIAKEVLKINQAVLATFSLLLISVYSIEFPKYFTHSVLCVLLSSCSLYLCIKIIKSPMRQDVLNSSSSNKLKGKTTILHYLLLGVCLGLGILAKYNFAVVIMALLASALMLKQSRKLILNSKILLTFGSFLATIAPHLLWVLSHNAEVFAHAMSRGSSGELDFLSKETIKNLGNVYGPILFFFVVFLIFFFKNFKIDKLKAWRSNQTSTEIKFLYLYSIIGILVPISLIFLFQLNHFLSRWTAMIYIPVIFSLFTFIDFENKEGSKLNQLKPYLFILCCTFLPLGFLAKKAYNCYFPDNVKSRSKLIRPYGKLYRHLEKLCEEEHNKDCLIVSYDSNKFLANFTIQNGKVPVIDFYKFKENLTRNPQQYKKTNIYIAYSSKKDRPKVLKTMPEIEILSKGQAQFFYKNASTPPEFDLFYFQIKTK